MDSKYFRYKIWSRYSKISRISYSEIGHQILQMRTGGVDLLSSKTEHLEYRPAQSSQTQTMDNILSKISVLTCPVGISKMSQSLTLDTDHQSNIGKRHENYTD